MEEQPKTPLRETTDPRWGPVVSIQAVLVTGGRLGADPAAAPRLVAWAALVDPGLGIAAGRVSVLARLTPIERRQAVLGPSFAGIARYHPGVTAERTLYDEAGGMAFFEALVGRFYDRVAGDAILRPLYPDPDLAGARHRLTLFLAQYWGGPRTYDDERGHPRLRMRHAPFAIGPRERDAWLEAMREAIADVGTPPSVAARLHAYIDMAAEAMRNRD